MKFLAEALVESAAFIELSSETVIDPDSAVQALESIARIVSAASEEEKEALLNYCRGMAANLAGTQSQVAQKRHEFYLGFGVNLGLTDE